jgi:hypothetical protein
MEVMVAILDHRINEAHCDNRLLGCTNQYTISPFIFPAPLPYADSTALSIDRPTVVHNFRGEFRGMS